jgi:hypothetical protein
VTVVVVALMLAPSVSVRPSDDFPLSTYPMFAVDRGRRSAFSTAVGVTDDGTRLRLSPHLLAGTEEPILAVRIARQMTNRDPDGWCLEIATRVARSNPGPTDDPVVEIEVVTETHDVIATLLDDAPPVGVLTHATCEVPGA